MTQRQRRRGTRGRAPISRITLSQAIRARGRLWLLRGLMAGSAWKRLLIESSDDLDDLKLIDVLASTTVVHDFLEIEPGTLTDVSAKKARCQLRAHYRHLAAKRLPAFENHACLTEEIGLSPLEADLVVFAVLAKRDKGFQAGLALLGSIYSGDTVFEAIATCLAAPVEEVASAFGRAGGLTVSGLVSLNPAAAPLGDVEDWLEVLPGIAEHLGEPGLNAATLLKRYLKPPAEAARGLGDFDHIRGTITVLKPLLTGALSVHAKGVNVLLHGPTGTGKTALVHALAAEIGARLLEVSVVDEDGDALERTGRIQALRLVGRLGASGGNALILFDEVEDYFGRGWRPDSWDGLRPDAGPGKGFTVDLLESVPAPTFWITNDLDGIDPAFRRRFDFVLELTPPPPAVRERIAAHYLAPLGMDDPVLRSRLAAHDRLTPGLIARAAKTVALSPEASPTERTRMFEATLNGHLEALGLTPLPQVSRSRLPYGLQYLTLATDPATLLDALRHRAEGRFLFYGPPGTGKSALARHLADALALPYLKQRASDLLSPYVGESEQAIRAMFRRARPQGAVLVLDECDSFLTSRAHARQSWEVSFVNELLTQMEDYTGVFVATTNRLDALDEAALRRFDVKLEFPPLLPEKAALLFAAVLESEGCALSRPEHSDWQPRLARLDALTPGDFQAALRGLSLRALPLTPQTLFETLESECALKPSGRRSHPIGFSAPATAAFKRVLPVFQTDGDAH